MEWDSPAIVLDARPYGEGDAVAAVMTEAHGLHRGLARGGASRGKAATWQAGNLVQVQWIARLSDHLGSFTGEMIHPGAANAMDQALPLAMLTSVCSVAEGALPERVPQPRIFGGLLGLIPRMPLGASLLTDVVQWEMIVLADLGYGLDLSACAVTGSITSIDNPTRAMPASIVKPIPTDVSISRWIPSRKTMRLSASGMMIPLKPSAIAAVM